MPSTASAPQPATSTQYLGVSVPRREDFRFLTGTGTFSEDITLTGMLYASLVRSTLAHADIVSINTEAARAMPGVVAVFTAADFSDDEMGTIPTDWTLPIMDGIPDRYPLARDAVKYVGEAVAVVIAETRAQADDAAYFVDVEYAERRCVVDAEAATREGAPLVHDRYEANTSYVWHLGTGDWDAVAASCRSRDRCPAGQSARPREFVGSPRVHRRLPGRHRHPHVVPGHPKCARGAPQPLDRHRHP